MKTKELRELLVPTPAKIIIFLVLFMIFVPVVEYDTGIRCITTPCASAAPGSAAAYLLSPEKFIYQFYYISIVMGIAATYLVSCLLVSLAENVKR